MKTKFTTLERIVLPLMFIFGLMFSPFLAFAQDGITLSLTPPFFQLTINPNESWSSSIKVVNVNEFPLTLYASIVNFEASGEVGKGKFTPLLSDDPEYRKASLAGWIDVTNASINISPGNSAEVPFTINAPADASPGGHYAAILIGTEPIDRPDSGPFISVSSLISSLVFVRVSGDVVEDGDIRELSTEKIFYSKPEVPISLRFENSGNVHLLPQGDITIFNMWGKERGKIEINQRTEFGNVLPDSIRKFSYIWKGEDTPLEAGRYKASATLSFGKDSRKNVTKSTYFWVVPVGPALTLVGSLTLFILIVMWFIRRYVRRALGAQMSISEFKTRPNAKILAKPLVDGVMDLRNVNVVSKKEEVYKLGLISYVSKYKLFFIFVIFIAIASLLASMYFGEVLTPERGFEVEELQKVDKYEISAETE
jgi:hypothetical protein